MKSVISAVYLVQYGHTVTVFDCLTFALNLLFYAFLQLYHSISSHDNAVMILHYLCVSEKESHLTQFRLKKQGNGLPTTPAH